MIGQKDQTPFSRGVLFQIAGKFPRFTKERPEDKLTELSKLLTSLCSA